MKPTYSKRLTKSIRAETVSLRDVRMIVIATRVSPGVGQERLTGTTFFCRRTSPQTRTDQAPPPPSQRGEDRHTNTQRSNQSCPSTPNPIRTHHARGVKRDGGLEGLLHHPLLVLVLLLSLLSLLLVPLRRGGRVEVPDLDHFVRAGSEAPGEGVVPRHRQRLPRHTGRTDRKGYAKEAEDGVSACTQDRDRRRRRRRT